MINVFKAKSTGVFRYDFSINKRRYRGAIREARTLEQARLAAKKIWDDAFNRRYNPAPRETAFTTFYRDRFIPFSKLHKKSHYDDLRIGEVLCEFFGNEPIEQIAWERIEEFKNERSRVRTKQGNKRRPATINRELSVLSKALTLAVKANVIRRNPCREVERLKVDNARTRFLTEDEEARLFEALGDHQMVKDIVTMALNTGMRQGEIFSLRWFDVDLTRGFVHVRQTKTGKDRFIPINSRLRILLEGLGRSSEHVFPSPKTNRALIDVKRQFDRAKMSAGIPDFRFHDLRHTAATRMADNGADVFTIAAILGHSDIRMTSRYTHATDRARKAAVESLVSGPMARFGQNSSTTLKVVDVSA